MFYRLLLLTAAVLCLIYIVRKYQSKHNFMSTLAIALYRCEVDGVATESLDVQVRLFSKLKIGIEEFLRNELPQQYKNDRGQTVTWPFVQLLALEEYSPGAEGQEVIGFIAGCHEFPKWAGVSGQ